MRCIAYAVLGVLGFGGVAYAQSMAGKTCYGTFETNQGSGAYNRGAMRIVFKLGFGAEGTSEVSPGKEARDALEPVKYNAPTTIGDAKFTGTKLTFTTARKVSFDLTGNGTSFMGRIDPRSLQPYLADVVLNCR